MGTLSDGTTTIIPDLILAWETTQDGENVFHDVLGSASLDVTLRPASTRRGSLQPFFLTSADAEACRSMHSAGAVFTYDPDTEYAFSAMTYVVDTPGITLTLDPDTGKRWLVTVAFREVAA